MPWQKSRQISNTVLQLTIWQKSLTTKEKYHTLDKNVQDELNYYNKDIPEAIRLMKLQRFFNFFIIYT